MLAEGDVIAGKFRVDRVIGRGGMGIVVAATHVHLGQRVAMKFLAPELCGDRAVVGRFVREARASAQLRSEHICRVSDVGTLDNGAPYLVMELLEGYDLASMLASAGPVPVVILVDYIVQACLAVAEAHGAGIVHRDLKPANLFASRRPDGTSTIKVLDFGIAKAPPDPNFKLTQTATVMGSPGYMSPEQLRSSRDADARSDIWALGVILFELSSGRQPFVAETITELTLRVAMDPTPQLRGVNIPLGFEAIVYRCLEKDPARRFQDVAQLAMALSAFGGPAARDNALGVARILAVDPGAGRSLAPAATAMTTLGGSASSFEQPRTERRRWVVAITAIAVLAIAFVGVLKLRTGGSDASQAVAPPAAPTPAASAAMVPDAAVPMPVPIDAAPPDAAPAVDAAVDGGPRPDAPVRKITKPPRSQPPEDDVGNSRL